MLTEARLSRLSLRLALLGSMTWEGAMPSGSRSLGADGGYPDLRRGWRPDLQPVTVIVI